MGSMSHVETHTSQQISESLCYCSMAHYRCKPPVECSVLQRWTSYVLPHPQQIYCEATLSLDSLTGSLSQASSSVHPGKTNQAQLSVMVHLVDH